MYSNRQKPQRRFRQREPFDRRVDQFLETGRQFVDGVAGHRPGSRRTINSSRFSENSIERVGRWVGDKLDWFLEEEDEWMEPWQMDQENSGFQTKKPLTAISRRVHKVNSFTSSQAQSPTVDQEDWPEEDTFRVDRWKRPSEDRGVNSSDVFRRERYPKANSNRKLPRSSRRKN